MVSADFEKPKEYFRLIMNRVPEYSHLVFIITNTMRSARGEARAAKWRYPILGHKTAILATFFEIWTSNLFCPAKIGHN